MENKVKEYLLWKSSYAIPASVSYRSPIKIIVSYFKDRNIKSITQKDINSFVLFIKEHYNANYVNYIINILKDFIKFYISEFKEINISKIKNTTTTKTLKAVVTLDDFILISNSFNQWEYSEIRNKLIVCLLWDTGARISEILSLKISDIDIQKSVAIIETKKSKNYRWIAWSIKTRELLLRYLGIRLSKNSNEYLFKAKKRDTYLCVREFQRILKNKLRELDIGKNITPHSFRHGKAHEMVNKRADILEIKTILGHKNVESVLHYFKENKEESMRISSRYLD